MVTKLTLSKSFYATCIGYSDSERTCRSRRPSTRPRCPTGYGSESSGSYPSCAESAPQPETHKILVRYIQEFNRIKHLYQLQRALVRGLFRSDQSWFGWIWEIHCTQARKHVSKGSTLALKSRADVTRSLNIQSKLTGCLIMWHMLR